MREVKESGGSLTSRNDPYTHYKRKHFIKCIRHNLKIPGIQERKSNVTNHFPKNWKRDLNDCNQC